MGTMETIDKFYLWSCFICDESILETLYRNKSQQFFLYIFLRERTRGEAKIKEKNEKVTEARQDF